jgi:hypothetical protein
LAVLSSSHGAARSEIQPSTCDRRKAAFEAGVFGLIDIAEFPAGMPGA